MNGYTSGNFITVRDKIEKVIVHEECSEHIKDDEDVDTTKDIVLEGTNGIKLG